MWISLCAAKRRVSDRYYPETGGLGEPKLPGKFFGDVLVDLRVRNIDLRFPAKHSLLGRSGRAAFLVTLVASMFPVRAQALSCRFPQSLYFLDCEAGRCLPMFRTDFAVGYGCAGRTVLESIEFWEVQALSGEIDRRGLEPDGVLAVRVSGGQVVPPDCELDPQAEQLEFATMEPIAESAEAVRRRWKQIARDQLWGVVVSRLPAWVSFLVLILLCALAARSVWNNAIWQSVGGTRPISGAITLQVLIVASGVRAFLRLDDGYGVHLGLWPIALAGAIAFLFLIAEFAAIGVKRRRGHRSGQGEDS